MIGSDAPTGAALRALLHPETDEFALDRRRFLQLVGVGAGAGLAAGSTSPLLGGAIDQFGRPAWAAGPVGPTEGILVVIGLYGGNDGLNTVVPLNDGNYRSMHGDLAIPAEQTLRLDDDFGLNPALTELHSFWQRDQLAIVQGVGYPDPDLSHFNSMGFWMAGRPHALPESGWLGRWLDGHLAGRTDLFAAAEVGYSVPLHLVGRSVRGTVVPPSAPGFGADRSERKQRGYDAVRSMVTGAHGPWHAAVGQAMADQIDLAQALAPVIPDDDLLPDDKISARLEVAARLINANLGFRVVTAGWGDFDSHAGQPEQHPVRMQELNAAIKRFFELLDPAWSTRVTVMTFSEFGRTPWDNDGAGTDHGSSAPQLVFGANVRGGMYGAYPSLAGLNRWDRPQHHVDFRSYYASILDGWLGGGSSDVLGRQYENLRLFRRGPGMAADGSVAPGPASLTAASGFLPLEPSRIADTRDGTGGVRVGKIPAGGRVRVRARGVAGVPANATGVVVNVTAVDATDPMYFTVYPGGSARPLASNLNSGPGRPVPNLVVMAVGDDGTIDVFNSHGATHCVVDVFGYFVAGGGDGFVPTGPARLFDTRSGHGIRRGRVSHREGVDVQVAGKAGVPPSGAVAVVMNLTVTEPDGPGFTSVSPAGRPVPDTSNLNYVAGDTVPNLTICKLGTGGKVSIQGSGGSRHVVGDVFGYFVSNGDRLRAAPPRRIMDSRLGLGSAQRPVGPGRPASLAVGGSGAVPRHATAVVLNVTATNVAGPSFVTVWPAGEADPGTSNLNLVAGQTVANLVICRLGEDGALSIGNRMANCDVVVDVLGYFTE